MLDWPEIDGRIIMLEPRRVAARNVAHFVARQRGCSLGDEVGYRVRGESRVSTRTRLEVVTEGVLTRMIQQDPELTGVGLVIFDEIHERHLTTDLSLALALEVQASLRDDLKILAMSATLSGLPLHEVMPDAPVLESAGRSFPVTICHQPLSGQTDWLPQMGQAMVRLLQQLPAELEGQSHPGVLAFLPGKGEIQRLQQYLQQRLPAVEFDIYPLYGELSGKAQDAAVAPGQPGRSKIVLATNVAESSLTIDGISIVVDCGYRRHAGFNPKTGVTRLSLKRISQASATQRAGRAGRLQAGYCLRLWGQEEHDRLPRAEAAEILHADLVSMALDCASWGGQQLAALQLLTPPPVAHEQQAWQLLQSLELVDEGHKLTALGRQAYALGCHPRLAYMLLKAQQLACSLNDAALLPLACLVAGVMEARGLPRRGEDISQYLVLATQGQSGQQVYRWLQRFAVTADLSQVAALAHPRDIGLLLALAYPDRIARRRGVDGFVLANGTGVTIATESTLAQQDYLVVADFQESAGRSAGRIYLASAFEPLWLDGPLAHLVTEHTSCRWDEQASRVSAVQRWQVGQLVIREKPVAKPDRAMIKQALLGWVSRQGLSVLEMDDAAKQLCIRVALARESDRSEDWPDFSDDALQVGLADWLGPYLDNINSAAQLAKLNVRELLLHNLSWTQQQQLKALLPSRWPLPTGTAPIRYEADGRALMSLRLQEAFGMADSPSLLNGQLKVTMELLSPARRPLALTADLASFWAGPYTEVKKEMRGRYPKHVWPDDPANTTPTKYTKKNQHKN